MRDPMFHGSSSEIEDNCSYDCKSENCTDYTTCDGTSMIAACIRIRVGIRGCAWGYL